MKKSISIILIAATLVSVLSLCSACFADADSYDIWYEGMKSLTSITNYEVRKNFKDEAGSLTTKTNDFDKTKSKIVSADEEIIYENVDGVCYRYILPQDSEKWLKENADFRDEYFYDQDLLQRINKLSAWINDGQLKYDKETNSFFGTDLKGSYSYENHETGKTEKHVPVSISIQFKTFYEKDKNGDYIEKWIIGGLREEYRCEIATNDELNPVLSYNQVMEYYIGNINCTNISIPEKYTDNSKKQPKKDTDPIVKPGKNSTPKPTAKPTASPTASNTNKPSSTGTASATSASTSVSTSTSASSAKATSGKTASATSTTSPSATAKTATVKPTAKPTTKPTEMTSPMNTASPTATTETTAAPTDEK